VSTKTLLAAAFLVAVAVLSWQAGGVVKAWLSASVAEVSAESIHRAPDPVISPPSAFVLNLVSGGSFTCRQSGTGYRCTPTPVLGAARGARS
jgi:hypothetical protein